ncbi:MAG: hypothetical protein KTR32_10845 [Granulosicoccus sp.]|nr:hypothetical protein [Granulosicoccus sp.]
MNTQGFNEPAQTRELELTTGEILVADVVVETHPVLSGRVLVTGQDGNGRKFEDWIPCLSGLQVQARDRVLIQRPANFEEPLVTGIVESGQRTRDTAKSAQSLNLQLNESLRINDHNGEALVDIVSGENGTRVQLHQSLAEMDVAGKLKMAADSVEIEARQGEMVLSASGDIKVDGEMIKLN